MSARPQLQKRPAPTPSTNPGPVKRISPPIAQKPISKPQPPKPVEPIIQPPVEEYVIVEEENDTQPPPLEPVTQMEEQETQVVDDNNATQSLDEVMDTNEQQPANQFYDENTNNENQETQQEETQEGDNIENNNTTSDETQQDETMNDANNNNTTQEDQQQQQTEESNQTEQNITATTPLQPITFNYPDAPRPTLPPPVDATTTTTTTTTSAPPLQSFQPGMEEEQKRIEANKQRALQKRKEAKEKEDKMAPMNLEQRAEFVGSFYWTKVDPAKLKFSKHVIEVGRNVGKATRKLLREGQTSSTGEFPLQIPTNLLQAGPSGPFGSYQDRRNKKKWYRATNGQMNSYDKIEESTLEYKFSNRGIPGEEGNKKITRAVRTIDVDTKQVTSIAYEEAEINMNMVRLFVLLRRIEKRFAENDLWATDMGNDWMKAVADAKSMIMRLEKISEADIKTMDQDAADKFKQKVVMELLNSSKWASMVVGIDSEIRKPGLWTDSEAVLSSDYYYISCSKKALKPIGKNDKLTPEIQNCPMRWGLWQRGFLYNGPIIGTSSGQQPNPFDPNFKIGYNDIATAQITIRPNPHKKNTVGFSLGIDMIILEKKSVFDYIRPIDEFRRITNGNMNGLYLENLSSPTYTLDWYQQKLIANARAGDEAEKEEQSRKNNSNTNAQGQYLIQDNVHVQEVN